MGWRHGGLAADVAAWLLAGVGALACPAAQEPASQPLGASAAAPGVAEPVLVAPTQGRPVFVKPGGVFQVVAQFAQPPRDLRFELVSPGFPRHRRVVSSLATSTGTEEGGLRFDLTVPADVPEQTYDLEVSGGGVALVGRHAVAVQRVGRRVRLVHLSNMNVGEVGAPDFDQRLIAEVNLLAPTLIIVTGDLLDATHEDPAVGWAQAADFLARFDAPALVACGDHDDIGWYSRLLAPSPIGAVQVGPYRGLVLYDVPARPIGADEEQIGWVERELGRGRPPMRFVVTHDESPNLLRYWQQQGTLAPMVRAGRLGLWFAGGHRDWDGREYRAIVDAAAPLQYLRTHQSSSATRDGAEGVSHYRVVDLDGGQAMFYGPTTSTGIPASIPVGRLNVTFDRPNDGSSRRVRLAVTSGLPLRVDHLAARVLLRREGTERPWSLGAHLAHLVEFTALWECWVTFDLPDKGSRRVVVGTGPEPQQPDVEVRFAVPRSLTLRPVESEDGVTYLRAGDWVGMVYLENRGSRAVTVTPVVRLDGERVAYRVVEEPGPLAGAYRVRLAPEQVLTLQLDMSAVRVTPGRRELQVYLKGGPAQVPVCWPLDVAVSQQARPDEGGI